MRVDSDFIEMGLYDATLNKAQFEILGESYPPNEGWESLVLEKELSQKDTNLFLLLRGDLTQKAQKQIEENYQLLAIFSRKSKEKIEEPKKIKSNTIKIYCDGACQGNPGRAGSGLAIYDEKNKPTLLYGEFTANGTNNSAELNALYKALLLALESNSSKVTIYCDSKYSIDCITKWAYGWKSKGWSKRGGEIKNLEIIKLSHNLYEEIKNRVTIKHVKGHSGVEGNELADRMAVFAISKACSGEYKSCDYENIDDILKL